MNELERRTTNFSWGAMSINCLSTCDDAGRFREDFIAIRSTCGTDDFLQDQISYLELALDPCWQPMEYWIAYDGGKPFGRVGARISSANSQCGFIGLLATTDETKGQARIDLLSRLLVPALSWLRVQGAKVVYAPVDCNTWLRYRVTADSEGDFESPFAWEPVPDPDLQIALRQVGFDEAATAIGGATPRGVYHTRAFKGAFSRATRALAPHYTRALQDGFSFRAFGEGGRSFKDELAQLHRIVLASFTRQFLFEPIDLLTFTRIYSMGSSQLDLSPSAFIVSPEAGGSGEPVGFMFAFVDRGYVVVKTVAVLPELAQHTSKRRWSAASALLYLALCHGEKANLQGGISALVHTDGTATTVERWMAWASAWTRHYELLARAL